MASTTYAAPGDTHPVASAQVLDHGRVPQWASSVAESIGLQLIITASVVTSGFFAILVAQLGSTINGIPGA
jgi:hypothetical protein